MRTAGSVILILLTIPLVIIGILAATLKFQLLEPKFWENSFDKNNVYTGLTAVVKQAVIDQTVKEGGKASEITSITDLISIPNVKDFVNRNLENLLNFANGKVPELLVYIPVGRAPKGFLPKNFENLPETMPLTSLLSKLNITGITGSQLQYISLFGRGTFYLLAIDGAFILIFTILLFILTERGKRFVGPAALFIISGIVFLGSNLYINSYKNFIINIFDHKADALGSVITLIVPPLIRNVTESWMIIGLTLLVIGVVLFFFKSPENHSLES